jgi:hypothetical protein
MSGWGVVVGVVARSDLRVPVLILLVETWEMLSV